TCWPPCRRRKPKPESPRHSMPPRRNWARPRCRRRAPRGGGEPARPMAGTMTAPAQIHVLAGVNGAGKSSIIGATIRDKGGEYYNPDEAARAIMAANPGLGQTEANAAAGEQGRKLLERAIDQGLDFTFETTLGGNTMPGLLAEATKRGVEVH